MKTVKRFLSKILAVYKARNITIDTIFADPEFEPLSEWFPNINTTGADDHVGDIERYVRTVKDRVRSTYRMLPFTHIPILVLVQLVKNAVFWLGSFPARNGVSKEYSPRYIVTGYELDYNRHVRAEFGEYVQTHEEHSNDMKERTVGAICLGPTGNREGSHWFMNLATGARIRRSRWTPLPMPTEVKHRVSQLGRAQGMPAMALITKVS